MAGLVDQYGAPVQTGRYSPTPSRDAGAWRGSMANWNPHRVATLEALVRERVTAQRRAADLTANDWVAKSGIRTIADNAIGTGLTPKSSIPHELLGISREEAALLGQKMEWAFSIWSQEAHARGISHFEDLQYLGIHSVLRLGEMLHLPVMLQDESQGGRAFSLAIQDIHPSRLCTPADKKLDLHIRDGIEFAPYGKPIAYWIACPEPSLVPLEQSSLFSDSFVRRPAYLGHRCNVFHLFRYEEEEQTRGVSALSTGMGLMRNLKDALDSELFAQVIAASFPVFIGLENRGDLPPDVKKQYGYDTDEPERTMDINPGTVIFGQANEKPYVLENTRPSSNFVPFVSTILRAASAMLGIPYESLTKDYSSTNYSSMRAALNEAWRLYQFYRRWFSRLYCQPIWDMVVEEAYLRNFLGLADDLDAVGAGMGFYEGRRYWCSAEWIGPAKGFIDPTKEIEATVMALQARLMTYADAWAERGGDFADALPQLQEEQKMLGTLQPLQVTGGTRNSSSGRDTDTAAGKGEGGENE